MLPSWVVKATQDSWHQQLVFVCENSRPPHYFSMAEKFKYGSTHHPMRRHQSVCWGIANLNHIFYYYRKNCLSFSAQGHLKQHPQLFKSILCSAWLGSHRSTITETSQFIYQKPLSHPWIAAFCLFLTYICNLAHCLHLEVSVDICTTSGSCHQQPTCLMACNITAWVSAGIIMFWGLIIKIFRLFPFTLLCHFLWQKCSRL